MHCVCATGISTSSHIVVEWFSPEGYLDGSGALLDKDEIDVYQYIEADESSGAAAAAEAPPVRVTCPVAKFTNAVQKMCADLTARGDPEHRIFWTGKGGRLESIEKPRAEAESDGGGGGGGGGSSSGALAIKRAVKRAQQLQKKRKPLTSEMIASMQSKQDKDAFMELVEHSVANDNSQVLRRILQKRLSWNGPKKGFQDPNIHLDLGDVYSRLLPYVTKNAGRVRGKACFQIRQILVAWLTDRYTNLTNRKVAEGTSKGGAGVGAGGGGAAALETAPSTPTPSTSAVVGGSGGAADATPTNQAVAMVDGWSCSACTFQNLDVTLSACGACGIDRSSWACTICTCRNPDGADICSACETPRSVGGSVSGNGSAAAASTASAATATAPPPEAAATLDLLFGAKDQSAAADGTKCTFDLSHGFLVQTAKHLQQRITDGTLADYCVICDGPHIFQASGLMPTCCTSGICTALFNDHGVGRAAADGVATSTEVLDLLVSLSRAAAKYDAAAAAAASAGGSTRHGGAALVPYPRVENPANRDELWFDPDNKDDSKVNSVLEQFPTMASVSEATDRAQVAGMISKGGNNELALPLLSWIINSNTSHIQKLPPARQFGRSIGTMHQYHLLTAPIARERIFSEAKAKHGTTFCFHGSNVQYWHAILRSGILNMSGTKGQLNGAAYGPGVYLSPQAGTSIGYSGAGGAGVGYRPPVASAAGPAQTSGSDGSKDLTNRFLQSSEMIVMALCEVVNSPGLKRHNANIWTHTEHDHVVTRVLFIWEDRASASKVNAHSTSDAFMKEVKKALSLPN